MGEVVSSLEEIYHSAELSNLILSPPSSMAKVTYLKIDTNVVFFGVLRGLFGIYDTQNDIWGEVLKKRSSVHHHITRVFCLLLFIIY